MTRTAGVLAALALMPAAAVAQNGYSFIDSEKSAVRYSLTGAITKPREVLRGGYLSWHGPVSDHWWQSTWLSGDAPTFSYPLLWSFGGKQVDE